METSTADTEALKDALKAILGVVLMALLCSVLVSPGSEGSESEQPDDGGGG